MTPLRQKLIDEIHSRGFSPNTEESYVRTVARLAGFYHRSPNRINDQEIRSYLLHLLHDEQLARSSLIVAVSGLRFFYRHILHRSTTAIEQALPPMKRPVRQPQVYSVEELSKLFSHPELNPKHRALLMTTYGAGLRVSEVCHLKVEDLLSDRMQIRVVQGKGAKDRYTVFSPRLIEELRVYWLIYRPEDWLFPSKWCPQSPITTSAALQAFHGAVERAGLPDRGGIHSLPLVRYSPAGSRGGSAHAPTIAGP
jgi:integrase/recombinase XerD